MKMTEKTKKYLAVGSGAIICVALIAAIALQFGKSSSGERSEEHTSELQSR